MTDFRVALPSQERLHQLFEYSLITGLLYVKAERHGYAQGQAVDCTPAWNKDGSPRHARVRVDGRKYLQHRIIWKMITGQEPRYIDHASGDTFVNAWHNLRDATQQENCFNKSASRSGASKYKGVDQNARSKKWRARIMVHGKHISLGYFKTELQAAQAYQSKARELHGTFYRSTHHD